MKSTICCVALFSLITYLLGHQCYQHQCYKQVDLMHTTVGFCGSVLMAYHAIQHNSLTVSAGITAVVVGTIICSASYIYYVLLLVFFLCGTRATNISNRRSRKAGSAPRNYIQVLCNGGVPASIAGLQFVWFGPYESAVTTIKLLNPRSSLLTYFHLTYIGCISSSLGDTLASELAPHVALYRPVLMTKPWKYVPIGTNGGVTFAGFVISCLGGFILGMTDYILLMATQDSVHKSEYFYVIPVSILSAFIGNFLDSLIGSTLQYSGIDSATGLISEIPSAKVKHISGLPILDNNLVNLASSILTASIVPFMSRQYLLNN